MGNAGKVVRIFPSGASRDTDEWKLDYEGFLAPNVLECYAEYMHENRFLADGTVRDSDNWQKGIERSVYMKSLWRHFMDLYLEHRGHKSREGIKKALCGIMFNTMGYLFEVLREERNEEIVEEYSSGGVDPRDAYFLGVHLPEQEYHPSDEGSGGDLRDPGGSAGCGDGSESSQPDLPF